MFWVNLLFARFPSFSRTCLLMMTQPSCSPQAMGQFPEDVKLTRDALALLGHVASMEHVGQTFLTTHGLYHEVVLVLQRHVADGIVGVSEEGLHPFYCSKDERSRCRVPCLFRRRQSPQAKSASIIRSQLMQLFACSLLAHIGGVIAATCCTSPAQMRTARGSNSPRPSSCRGYSALG